MEKSNMENKTLENLDSIPVKTPDEFFTDASELKIFMTKPKFLNDDEKAKRKSLMSRYKSYVFYNSNPEYKEKLKAANRLNAKKHYHENKEYREKKKVSARIHVAKIYKKKKEEMKQLKEEVAKLKDQVNKLKNTNDQ